MDDKELVGLLRRQITRAQDNGPSAAELKRAVDYYYGRPRGDEVPGRSQVQSLDVADMIHAVMAQILPSFTQDAICQFEPDGPDDDALARLESDAVNRVVMESNRGYAVLYQAIKDALLLKNGIVKVWLDEDKDYRRVRVGAVDPLRFIVGSDQACPLLEDYGGFCAEQKDYARGELVEMGFDRDLVARIPVGDIEADNTATSARNRQGTDPERADAGWANEVVTVWECYAELPASDEASTAELYRCLVAGSILLLKERADYVPYAAGTGFIEPHKFWGLSMYDRLKTVQDAKTAIQRQWIDNLANCNNTRTVINDRVNLDDYTDTRPGGAVRVEGAGPVQDSLMPLAVLDAGPAALSYLQYLDQVRADRGGAALQMANAEAQLTGAAVGSQGVDRIYSVQEAMAGMIARTLAETLLRSLFLLVHRVLRTELQEPLTLRLADQWVQVDPSEWRPRDRVNIKSGLSPGEKARKQAALSQVIQYQWAVLQAGQDGTMVTLPNLYNAYLDWASANDLDAGEKYFTDSRSQTSQAAAEQKGQQAQQQQALQMQMQQALLQVEQAKVELDKYKADLDARTKLIELRVNAETEEAKIVGAATTELQRVQLEAERAAAGGDAGGGAGSAGGGRTAA